jgi:hypothetical protein
MLEFFGDLQCSFRVALNDFNVALFLKRERQSFSYISAARNQYAFIGRIETLKFTYYCSDVFWCSDKKNIVTGFDNGIAVWDNGFKSAIYCDNARLDPGQLLW